MRKTLLPVLLAGVVMPFAAFAQGTTAPATQTPAMSDESAPAQSMEPAASPDAGSSTMDSTTTTTTATDTVTPPAGAASDTASTPKVDTGSDMASSGAVEGPFVTVPPSGAWRASDLEGKEVYDTTGENIGSISDVLLSEQGEVIAVLVGVGGFLGIGQKDVAVAMNTLEFGPGKTEGLPTAAEASATAEAAAPAAGGMAADPAAPAGADMTASTAEPVTPVVGEDNLPDRIVLNVTREELESAAAYGEEVNDMEDDAAATGAAPTTPAPDTGMAPASDAPAAQ